MDNVMMRSSYGVAKIFDHRPATIRNLHFVIDYVRSIRGSSGTAPRIQTLRNFSIIIHGLTKDSKEVPSQIFAGKENLSMTHQAKPLDLKKFGMDPERGFLPLFDPLTTLTKEYFLWEDIAEEMPDLLAQKKFRARMNNMRMLGTEVLRGREVYRAKLLLDFFASAYVWSDWEVGPKQCIPACIAVPLCEISRRIGRPPILSYASYALYNWRRLERSRPVALGNLEILQHFLGDVDEEWFILVHVQIEAQAAQALRAIPLAQYAAAKDYPEELGKQLVEIVHALQNMNATFLRMPENCRPHMYYTRVRPYIHGWKNPALPCGVVYEGVRAYAGKPQEFRGETGAQSSIVPCLDAFLGIRHAPDDALSAHLLEMREYMPPRHRAFVDAVARGPSVRTYMLAWADTYPFLCDIYNECIQLLYSFRSKHLEYAVAYIHKQEQKSAANPTNVGTGDTPFMPSLKKHADETLKHLIQ